MGGGSDAISAARVAGMAGRGVAWVGATASATAVAGSGAQRLSPTAAAAGHDEYGALAVDGVKGGSAITSAATVAGMVGRGAA